VNEPDEVKKVGHETIKRSFAIPKLVPFTLIVILLAAFLILWLKFDAANGAGQRPVLGLMTTLPLQWEEGEIGDIIQSGGVPSPAYSRLNSKFDIRSVDSLVTKNIKNVDVLLLAQPRQSFWSWMNGYAAEAGCCC
jgi:hypothetical protein